MSALLFLAFAVVVSLIGFGIVYLRSRQPTSIESGIDDFRREMEALSPDEAQRGRHRHAAGPSRAPARSTRSTRDGR